MVLCFLKQIALQITTTLKKEYICNLMKIKLLLADENQLFRELLAERFSQTSDFEIVAEADESDEIIDKTGLARPDIVLTEVLAPRLNGIEVTKSLFRQYPDVKVSALTAHSEKSIIKGMLEAQAWGYLMKSTSFDQLTESLRQIHSGSKRLSPYVQGVLIEDYLERGTNKTDLLTKKETEILKLLAEGKSIKEISETYFISIKTAGTHKQNVFDKLGFDNIAQLVRYALKHGIVT